MKNLRYVLLPLLLIQHFPVGAEDSFFKEVAKGVAVNVLSEVIKSAITSATQATPKTQASLQPQSSSHADVQLPKTVDGSVDDKERVKAIVAALTNTNTPLEERIGLYATKVDYFSSGVVDHEFILKDRKYFEKRWPERTYRIVSIDEIAVDPGKRFAAARFTVEYVVARPGDQKSGTSQTVVLLGSFNVQPRVYAIKEWVHRN